jgi:hypothetical protein
MAKKRMSPGLILTRQAALRPFVVLLFLFLLGRGQLYEAFFLVPREELVEGLWPPCAQCPSREAVCDNVLKDKVMEWNGMEWNGMIGLIDEGVDPSIYMYNEGTHRHPWGLGLSPFR